jgi:GABA permease
VLVVANRTAQSDELLEALRERSARGPASFTLLVPAAWEVGDPHGGRETALRRVKGALRRLRDAGLQVEGVLGDPDPALAVEQVWDPERFDEIIVSTLPARISTWLKLDLPRRVERFTGRPVRHVVASEIGEREITTTQSDLQRPAELAKNRP